MSFKIETNEEIEEEYHPEYLLKNIANFKAKHAYYPKSRHDRNGIDFFKVAKDNDYEIIHQIPNIYRVKKGGLGEKLVWSDNLIMRDKEGNNLEPQFYHTYGVSKYPIIIDERDRNGKKIKTPGGIKLKHEIEFNGKEVEKIVKLCHEDFKSQINFCYCEIANDSKEPVNTTFSYGIKSQELFKNASNKDIKKMVAAKRTEIDNIEELNSPPFSTVGVTNSGKP